MKTPASRGRMLSHAHSTFIELLFLVTVLLLKPCSGAAVTFTNDTLIGPFDTNFDGADIVLSGCTVTIDGLHSFASLQVRDGGVLTHSFSTNGLLALTGSMTGEVQVLTLTNVALLNNPGVIGSSIVVSDLARTLAYSNGVDYVVLDQGNGLVGLQLLAGSAIPEGSTNLVDYVFNRPAVPVGLNLLIATNVWVEVGGRVLLDGRGYGGGMGPGAGVSLGYPLYSGSGGGHGGFGGAAWTNSGLKQVGAVYGSVRAPILPGSGGGGGLNSTGGAGGGALKLVAGGWVRIDGTVSANGGPGLSLRTGGGAGGSVWISCQTLLGSGGIFANGGAGEPGKGGGGGGGRVALYQSLDLFNGVLSAVGASGWQSGGPGTLYTRLADQPVGTVIVDNGGPPGSSLLHADSEPVHLSILGGTLLGLQSTLTFTNLEVGSNAWVQLTTQGINVLRDAIIEAGGGLLAEGSGYASGTGPGAGHYYSYQGIMTGGGGGHGGFGAVGGSGPLASGGTGYDSFTAPALPGSGGGTSSGSAGAGGGVINLNVGGTLVLNGRISANGTAGIYDGSGGGAGGSVWITANALAGTGTISADGGPGNGFGPFAGGGGGGGRISLQYAQNYFFGSISARGSGGFAWGGAGTIYTKVNNQLVGQLLLDNGGPLGAGTVWTYAGGNTLDLVVRAGAVSSVPSQQQPLNSLLIGPDGSLLLTNQSLTVNGNATIQPGGKLVADGLGYPGGQGPGAGRSDYRYSSAGGGGYGGNGGSVPGSTFPTGGTGYGNPTSPTDLGSGGGSPSNYGGGAGGGNLRLTVNGVLEVDGRLSSNGTDATGPGAGGGAGGTVYLSVGSLTGSGTISANGGQGLGGGGGGGGRVALFCGANAFSGGLQARGGSGISWGGAGTIYKTTRYGSYYGQLLIDNGGQPGAFTPLSSVYQVDLILSGGAICTAAYTVNLSSLLIGSNSWVVMSNSYAPGWTVMSNAIIQAGGGIVADGTGYAGGTGPGTGRYSSYTAGGGGYGGYGGAGTNLAAYGGTIYGSLTTPSDLGSGGGFAGISYSGGSGGGAIRLTVNGALQVDGRISANGLPGTNSSAGGGSGGSIYLTIGTLTGSGIISANGGMGNVSGGGGGGGRIAIYYGANVFQGNLSAFGGGGVRRGGAGTIYTRLNNQQSAQVIVDNGGLRGTNTSWSGSYPVQLVVSGGGVFVPSSSQVLIGLSVASNGWVFLGAGNQPLTITSSATVQAGGGIIADGAGYAGGQGPGAGAPQSLSPYGWTAGGGGHGGYGSSGAGGTGPLGGGTYDVVTAPTSGGSGGGGVVNPSYGGAGGGVIRLSVTGALVVNGRISADGLPGMAPGAGGGAGGSLWLTVGTLSGNGVISANGGPGNGWGGGGGGGRVAIEYSATLLPVSVSAYGGAGATSFGGAGTIYFRPMGQQVGRVLVDNGGHPGTNTPLVSLSAPFDLTIQNGAILVPQTSSLILSNLFVGPGGTLKPFAPASVLDLSVLRDATIDLGGILVTDGQGSVANTGVGHGLLSNGVGSGAGYGGMGGAGSNVLGGITYGSEQQPLSSGSGGGASSPSSPGSSGGGVIRLSVGRALTVNGLLSANGAAGAADNAGGGSGGSIWVDANYLTGAGVIAANGGAGELALGGGGGGGRIAMYAPLNVFQGIVAASGGDGYARGQDGTVYSSSAFAPFQGVSHTPVGAVGSPIDSIYLTLNTAFNPASLTTSDVLLLTPTGMLSEASCTVSSYGARQVRISFPAQTAEGDYKLTFGPQLQSLFGQPLSDVYTGAFSILWPTIAGLVTDTNNQPVPGVVIQAGDAAASTVTDTNGNYLLKVVPGSSGNIVPQYTGLSFVPPSHSFSNLTYPLWNQDFLVADTVIPAMTSSVQDGSLVLHWYGLSGVTYHTLVSTNLADWTVADGPFWGTNGLLELRVPLGSTPQAFFRLQADY